VTLCCAVGSPITSCGPKPGDADPGTLDVSSWPRIESPLGDDPDLERRVADLLAAMSLEEKVGQVIQAEIQHVTPEDVRRYHLGSVLNGGGSFPGANKRTSLQDWITLADAYWEASMDTSDGGQAIPILWGVDAVHGHNNVFGATLFPHNIGLGAAHNVELVERIGEVTAQQILLTGQDWNFSPTVAVVRDDRWGRSYEGYSEDPEIVASYAGAMIRGIQGAPGNSEFLGKGRVLATAKHFIGDGGTDGGVDRGDNLASAAELRKVHFAGYETALRAGVQTVMASFNSWQGQKLHGHEMLLTEVLKNQVGFDGFVIGDWNGHGEIPGCSNDSCPEALLAGVDMYMVPEDWRALYENLLRQVEEGQVPQARLDDAVRRILRVKMRAGLFERERPSERPFAGREEILTSDEHRAVARQAVRESLVLLKNNGKLLPLRPGQRVLVLGDAANSFAQQTGGWTLTWQGTENTVDDFPNATTIWQGIRTAVELAGGSATLATEVADGVEADVAIVVYGEDPYAEFFGDTKSLVYGSGGTRTRDLATLQALKSRGIPVVSIFLSGRPLVVNAELNASDAFVAAWLPGTEGGGIADVIFAAPDGTVAHDFRGRLSFSWPRDPSQVVLNRHDSVYEPLFAYGYGLDSTRTDVVPDLAEEYLEEKTAQAEITEFFGIEAEGSWQFFVRGADGQQVEAQAGRATAADGSIVLVPTDRNAQEDARRASWSGGGSATLSLRSEAPVDLSSSAAKGLAIDLQLEGPVPADVTLGVACGEGCRGAVDVTQLLSQLPVGEWSTLVLPLRCVVAAGAELARVEAPFELTSSGVLSLVLSQAGLADLDSSADSCPDPQP
jgi:beta-glucosidase